MREVVVVAGARTAVGGFGGSLKRIPVVQLGALVLQEALTRAGLRPVASARSRHWAPDGLQSQDDLLGPACHYDTALTPVVVDEVFMGNVVGAGQGQNVARQAMIRAGIPKETPAATINMVCASGMKAVMLAAQAIRAGDAEVVLAGGMENMSRIPYAVDRGRWPNGSGEAEVIDLMVFDGLYEIFYGYHVGITAENIARRFQISRREQDEQGARSHRRARTAIDQGLFAPEIVPVPLPGEREVFAVDERPRQTSPARLGRLRPAFMTDGTVTAGNSSGINDGAAVLLLMSLQRARQLGLDSAVRLRACAAAGVDPAYMGLAPIPAVRQLLALQNLGIDDIDLIELNEAFAAQTIACMRQLGCRQDRTNLLGGGISIGHPIGSSGARILVTLLHAMQRRQATLGLATLCSGGGQGMATLLEQV
jgi:acetyl-CoA C-acetyltransferase